MERIRSDVGKFSKAVVKVLLVKGIVLNGAGHGRDGRRKELGERSTNVGGVRTKKEPAAEKWVHEDAREGQTRMRSGAR